LINLHKLTLINRLISKSDENICRQSETPQKLQNSTTGSCYLSQTFEAKPEKVTMIQSMYV